MSIIMPVYVTVVVPLMHGNMKAFVGTMIVLHVLIFHQPMIVLGCIQIVHHTT